MRFLIFALLLVLLPLRGWTGDAMATDRALSAVKHHEVAIKSIAACAHQERATALFDHHATGSAGLTDAPSDGCTACQACSTAALGTLSAGLPCLGGAFAHRSDASVQFESADTVRRQKPPIS